MGSIDLAGRRRAASAVRRLGGRICSLIAAAPELVALAALALALRAYRIGAESLWLDEAYTVAAVTDRDAWTLLVEHPLRDPHPPLYYVLAHGWTGLVGTDPAAVRLLSALFGVGTVVAVYLLGRALFDAASGPTATVADTGRVAATVAGLLVAIAPVHVWYAQEARMYTLLTLLTAVSTLTLVRAGARPGSRTRWAAYVLATAALCYTHVYGLFVVLAQSLCLAGATLARRHRGRAAGPAREGVLDVPVRAWIPAQAAVGALAAPWLAVLLSRALGLGSGTAVVSWIGTPGPTVFLDTLSLWLLGEGLLPTMPVLFVLPALAVLPLVCFDPGGLQWLVGRQLPVGDGGGDVHGSHSSADAPSGDAPTGDDGSATYGLAQPTRRPDLLARDRQALWLLAALTVVPVVVPYVLSVHVVPFIIPRYTIPASLGLALLVGRGVATLPFDSLGVLVVAALLLTAAPTLGTMYADTQKPEWEAAGAYTASATGAGDVVLVVPRWNRHTANVSYDGAAPVRPQRNDVPPETLAGAVAGHDTVAVVLGPDGNRSHALGTLRTVAPDLTRTAERSFHAVTVVVFDRDAGADGARRRAAGGDRPDPRQKAYAARRTAP